MAVSVDGEVTIKADAETVLATIADLENLPTWSNVHKQVTVEDRDDEGRPRKARMKVSVAGITDEQVLEYTWRPDGVSWRLLEGSQQRSQEGSYRVRPEGAGSHVRYELEIDPKIPLPGFVTKQASKKVVDAATKGLKQHLERR